MNRRNAVSLLATAPWAVAPFAHAQQARAARVGVIHLGGPAYRDMLDGLQAGLKALGLAEPRIALDMRDLKGDLNAVEAAAKSLERDKVNLIYAVSASVVTRVKQATTEVPIVFVLGNDPVTLGLVQGFAHPGGRLTGIHYPTRDLIPKRLSLLKEMLPELRRVLTFYNPDSKIVLASMAIARAAAGPMKIQILGRHVRSAEDVRLALTGLDAKEADAYFHVNDALVSSQSHLIIEAARAKKLPTMFQEHGLVARGALASYGVSYDEAGRLSARYVQQILAGVRPQDMAVESVSRVGLSINLNTAREIGVIIPKTIRLRADNIIE